MKLTARDLRLSFLQPNGANQTVLDIDRLAIESGQCVGFTGPSGAGKTTLMYALTGIQSMDSGLVVWHDTTVTNLSEARRDRWRREHVGIVFQDFHLFPGMSIHSNVLLPTSFGHSQANRGARERATTILKRVGAPHSGRSVETLSRGERQRVGIARALIMNPPILIADEPTANLDESNALEVASLLLEVAAENEATLLVISHDRLVLRKLDTVLHLENGKLTESRQ